MGVSLSEFTVKTDTPPTKAAKKTEEQQTSREQVTGEILNQSMNSSCLERRRVPREALSLCKLMSARVPIARLWFDFFTVFDVGILACTSHKYRIIETMIDWGSLAEGRHN